MDTMLPISLVNASNNNLNFIKNIINNLIKNKTWLDKPLEDNLIEYIIQYFSMMDSNNYNEKVGLGEREGRVYSTLVKKKNYNLNHGIGRSGDLFSIQPKAAGSSLIFKITNNMIKNVLKILKINLKGKNLILPVATGMSILLSLLSLKNIKPKNTVIFLRIDQKSGIKAIQAANLNIIIIQGIYNEGEGINTNLEYWEKILAENKDILAVLSTTSCFSPREPDDIIKIGKLCRKFDVYHLVNNAYGLQCKYLRAQISSCLDQNLVDLVVQSTDKNFLVPVGGSIVFSNKIDLIDNLSKIYPGRASINQVLDLFITFLSLGKIKLLKILEKREENYIFMLEEAKKLATSIKEKVILNKKNKISICITLKNSKEDVLKIASKIYRKNIMGARIVTESESKTIGKDLFKNFGSHIDNYEELPYLTIACAIGIKKDEIIKGFNRLKKVLLKSYK